jgi:hypothetical protein
MVRNLRVDISGTPGSWYTLNLCLESLRSARFLFESRNIRDRNVQRFGGHYTRRYNPTTPDAKGRTLMDKEFL